MTDNPFSKSQKHPLMTQQRRRFQDFVSLQWYEEAITFLFTFVAKTSEVLLAAGLVTSTANFLTDGAVMGINSGIANAWAWAQALAIDSSLSITFVHVFTSIKQRDWLKAICYGLLTCLLSFVAGTITNVETLSHALHITTTNATFQVGFDVKLLTTLRAIAVVGFVLMSRLKDVSFKDLYREPSTTSLLVSARSEEVEVLLRRIVVETLAQQGGVVIAEEQEAPSPLLGQAADLPRKQEVPGPPALIPENEAEEKRSAETPGDPEEEPEQRLERAYQELKDEGERISGRTLAARAHLRRTTCNQWLATYDPTSSDEESKEGAHHEEC